MRSATEVWESGMSVKGRSKEVAIDAVEVSIMAMYIPEKVLSRGRRRTENGALGAVTSDTFSERSDTQGEPRPRWQS